MDISNFSYGSPPYFLEIGSGNPRLFSFLYCFSFCISFFMSNFNVFFISSSASDGRWRIRRTTVRMCRQGLHLLRSNPDVPQGAIILQLRLCRSVRWTESGQEPIFRWVENTSFALLLFLFIFQRSFHLFVISLSCCDNNIHTTKYFSLC